MLNQVHVLVKIYMTIPVTSATAERSFSAFRRLKTYLRSTMTQVRLNNCAIMNCHKERVDALDLKDIAVSFVQANVNRMNYFGSF
ncbi:hypothetical protein CAPTEDRAFT_112284 [Capitella teleta]|uniref:HAT C-terminal dimerisation domain-containing protein n=1 Tax=Capitella teleta TaxID=283909 RepID=R7T7A7_CAPTE|nr:hypothetical protein CAPTEDRAFT_116307 [Capitella teleta]ELU03130.1 hypothetical protein CAPTEDRAFT_112284 [Capitella teleta]|eukprot:ELT87285.1 hypothetical protein CAPTEDRAFT_116307 [Capitella teleta]